VNDVELGQAKEYSVECVGTRVTLPIECFMWRARRSDHPRAHITWAMHARSARDARSAKDARSAHRVRHLPTSRMQRRSCRDRVAPRNARSGEISVRHNFEARREREIFHRRYASDEA